MEHCLCWCGCAGFRGGVRALWLLGRAGISPGFGLCCCILVVTGQGRWFCSDGSAQEFPQQIVCSFVELAVWNSSNFGYNSNLAVLLPTSLTPGFGLGCSNRTDLQPGPGGAVTAHGRGLQQVDFYIPSSPNHSLTLQFSNPNLPTHIFAMQWCLHGTPCPQTLSHAFSVNFYSFPTFSFAQESCRSCCLIAYLLCFQAKVCCWNLYKCLRQQIQQCPGASSQAEFSNLYKSHPAVIRAMHLKINWAVLCLVAGQDQNPSTPGNGL